MKKEIAVFWFRRDLRFIDNRGLYHALSGDLPVLPLFIFDTNILDELPAQDTRLTFIHDVLSGMNAELKGKGSKLLTEYGKPEEVWPKLIEEYNIKVVYTNRDYEPYARTRDKQVVDLFKDNGVQFKTFKDHVIFERGEVLKPDGDPYTVYTPYSKAWKAKLTESDLESYTSGLQFDNWYQTGWEEIIPLDKMGFERAEVDIPSENVTDHVLEHYKEQRDYPAIPGTSRLSVHLRFGTISIRQLARNSQDKSATYLNELIWREFYQMILWHFPRVVNESFRAQYDQIKWRNNKEDFERWKDGKTGYPIVDAGMRELNETGYMHNRVRMITASFLTKHLLIDWRWGEAYFAEKLLDYDLAANNGGWQWSAGCGTDAAPYFRVFNPYLQQEKFDPEMKYTRKWVPELDTDKYPKPMVDHKEARERALDTYKAAL